MVSIKISEKNLQKLKIKKMHSGYNSYDDVITKLLEQPVVTVPRSVVRVVRNG